jgi:integrase
MYAVMFALAAGTGLRAGELYLLNASEIDLVERRIVSVWRSSFDGEFQTTKNEE